MTYCILWSYLKKNFFFLFEGGFDFIEFCVELAGGVFRKCFCNKIRKKVNLQLNQLHKTKTHPFTYHEKHQNILQQHPDYLYIYTDGSKDDHKTACVEVLNIIIKTKALPMESSIFTAEACAIDLVLDIISKEKNKKFIIFSVSLSVL